MSEDAEDRLSDRELALLQRADEILEAALDLTHGDRAAFVARATAGEPTLRHHVAQLLDAIDKLESGVDGPEPGIIAPAGALTPELLGEAGLIAGAPEVESAMPERIGRYRVLDLLGRGGMGVVYLAERDDETYQQRVAVKLLEHTGPEARLRFERERQILAGLEHPNIARLIDGGVWRQQPYLVVELVDGVPIDQYCGERAPSLARRIKMLCTLCDAVDAAHRRLVVHRDLKPANVLVDQEGRLKLLDFGIAGLLEESPTDLMNADLTATHHVVMTPRYASPEQLLGQPVSVASDIYQIGLIAYEVLTGQRARTLEGSGSAMLRQEISAAIRAPSVVVRPHDRDLAKRLRGDLDTIVLASLRSEPEQRYRSANDLRDDLQRFLEQRPVHARSLSFEYRVRKFVRRNTLQVGLVSVLLLAGLVSTVWFTWRLAREGDRARTAAEKAVAARAETEVALAESEELVDFMVDAFGSADPRAQAVDQELTLRQMLARSSQLSAERFEDRPLVESRIRATLGRLHGRLGDFESAHESLARGQERLEAWADANRHTGGYDPTLYELRRAALVKELAESEGAQGERDRAVLRMFELVERLGQTVDPTHIDFARSEQTLATLLLGEGRHAEALEIASRCLAVFEHQGRPLEIAKARFVVGVGLFQTSRYEEAAPVLEQTLTELRRLAHDSQTLVELLSTVAHNALFLGDRERSLALAREALELGEAWGRNAGRAEEEPSRSWYSSVVALASALNTDQAYEESVALLRRANAAAEGASAETRLAFQGLLANALLGLERFDEARELHLSSLEMSLGLYGAEHPQTGVVYTNLGEAQEGVNDLEGAVASYERSRRIFEQALGPDHFFLSYPILNLGRLAAIAGDEDKAEQYLRRAVELRRGAQDEDAEELAEAEKELADFLKKNGSVR